MSSILRDFLNSRKNNSKKPAEINYLNEKPQNMEPIKINATIYGRVQGVGFRYSTEFLAKELKVTGTVKNQKDGSVYVEACASTEIMKQFIEILANGPSPSAQVEKVEIAFDPEQKNFATFSTVY